MSMRDESPGAYYGVRRGGLVTVDPSVRRLHVRLHVGWFRGAEPIALRFESKEIFRLSLGLL